MIVHIHVFIMWSLSLYIFSETSSQMYVIWVNYRHELGRVGLWGLHWCTQYHTISSKLVISFVSTKHLLELRAAWRDTGPVLKLSLLPLADNGWQALQQAPFLWKGCWIVTHSLLATSTLSFVAAGKGTRLQVPPLVYVSFQRRRPPLCLSSLKEVN